MRHRKNFLCVPGSAGAALGILLGASIMTLPACAPRYDPVPPPPAISPRETLERYEEESLQLRLEQTDSPAAKADLGDRLILHSKKYASLKEYTADSDVSATAIQFSNDDVKNAADLFVEAVEEYAEADDMEKAGRVYRDMIRKLSRTLYYSAVEQARLRMQARPDRLPAH